MSPPRVDYAEVLKLIDRDIAGLDEKRRELEVARAAILSLIEYDVLHDVTVIHVSPSTLDLLVSGMPNASQSNAPDESTQ
jgi:hypothetical protein